MSSYLDKTGLERVWNKATDKFATIATTDELKGNIETLTSTKADKTEVETAVAGLVDSAPEALNTLNELAAALGDDPNFATTVSTEIGKKVNKSEYNDSIASINANINSINGEIDSLQEASEQHLNKTDYLGPVIVEGNPVTYDNCVEGFDIKVETTFSPKQAGSGDPYPAGGGRNKLNVTAESQTVNGVTFIVNADGTVMANGTATDTILFYTAINVPIAAGSYILNGCPPGGGGGTYSMRIVASDNSLYEDSGLGKAFDIDAQSIDCVIIIRANVNVKDIVFKPMLRLASETDATYAPYSNIRPISGWDKLDLNHAGKNLFDQSLFEKYDFELVGWYYRTTKPIFPAGTYTWTKKNFESTVSGLTVSLQNEAANSVVCYLSGSENVIITSTEPLYLAVNYEIPGFMNTSIIEGQLELGSTPTSYEPYQGNTYTVQIGKTTCQGHYDWLTGKLTAEWAMQIFDGTEEWVETIEGNKKYIYYSPTEKPQNGYVVCSHMPFVYDYQGNGIYCHSKLIIVGAGMYSRYGTIAKWKEFLAAEYAAGTPVQVAYKLAEPYTIQLSQTQIKSLQGINTVYGDGDVHNVIFNYSNSDNGLITKIGNPITETLPAGQGITIKTNIELQQEGSSDPYPAGGGRNLCDKHAFEIGDMVEGTVVYTAGNYVSGYIAVKPNTTYTRSSNCLEGDREIALFDANKNYIDRAWGSSFTTPSNCYYVRLEWEPTYSFEDSWFQLEVGSVATEYAPYSNIRPFIGYDKLGLNHVGKNLIGDWVQGAVSSKGEEFSSNTVIRSAITKVGKKNIFVTVPDGFGYFLIEYADGIFANRTDRTESQAFVLRDNTTHIRLCLVKNDSSAITPSQAVGYQVEYGTVGTEVFPYQNKLYTVQIGQTVYGGKFDWLTGKLVAEWAMETYNGTENWEQFGSTIILGYSASDKPPAAEKRESTLCSHYPYSYGGGTNTCDIFIQDNGNWQARFRPGIDVTEWKTYLATQNAAGTPVQIAYKLATPIEIQLDTLGAIESVEGINTIYGDANLEVTFGHSMPAAYSGHIHKLEDEQITGVLPIGKGGTGATSAAGARSNLGITPQNIGAPISRDEYHASLDTLLQTGIYRVSNQNGVRHNYGQVIVCRGSNASDTIAQISIPYDDLGLPSIRYGNPTTVGGKGDWLGWYDFLTTKKAVTVAQGGTGATDAATARSNLGVPSTTGFGASGNWGINITGSSASCTGNAATSSALAYPAQITDQEGLDAFKEVNKFKVGYWNSFSPTGLYSNGIILSGGWTSDNFGFQIAIDDDPTWKIALRQKSTTWSDWKYIPMADGTNASGTWGISISGNAATASSVTWSGITSKPSYYDAKAIKGITRSGTTFTYTCMDGTTGTFTQQDNNTTYSAGNGLSLSSTTFSVSYGTSASALGTSSAGSATTVSRSDHVHALPALTSCTGTLTVAKGGTGITSNPSMLVNLGSTSAASVFAASPRPGITGTLGIGNGGTGATSKSGARTNLGITSGTTLPSSASAGDIFFLYS